MRHLEKTINITLQRVENQADLLWCVDSHHILIDRDPKFLQRLFSFFLHLLGSLHLLLPRFVQALHELLTGIHLVLEFGLRHCPDLTVLRLERDLLFLWWDHWIENILGRATRYTGCNAKDEPSLSRYVDVHS